MIITMCIPGLPSRRGNFSKGRMCEKSFDMPLYQDQWHPASKIRETWSRDGISAWTRHTDISSLQKLLTDGTGKRTSPSRRIRYPTSENTYLGWMEPVVFESWVCRLKGTPVETMITWKMAHLQITRRPTPWAAGLRIVHEVSKLHNM